MTSEYFPALSKKKTWRDADSLQNLLKDWYGRKAGSVEIIHHLPEAEHLKEGIDKTLKKLVNPELALLRKVKDGWNDIVGEQIAKVTCPTSFYKGILYVEVSHPVWLMQFGKNEKNMFLEKVQHFTKCKICRNIKFSPPGKRRNTV